MSEVPVSSSVFRPLSTSVQPGPETLFAVRGCTFEAVVGDGDQAYAAVLRHDVPDDAAGFFGGEFGVVERGSERLR